MWQGPDSNSDGSGPDFGTRLNVQMRGRTQFTVLVIGPSSLVAYWFEQEQVRIGRAFECDIVLPHQSVSRAHCCIYASGGDFSAEDQGSRNGTLLNRWPLVGRALLLSRDQLRIGPYSLSVRPGWQHRNLMVGLPGAEDTPEDRPQPRLPRPPGLAIPANTDPSLRAVVPERQTVPTMASLRRLIDQVLLGASDVDAFVFDHFRQLYRILPASSDRMTKVTQLLCHFPGSLILQRLREHEPDLVAHYEHILTYESP